VHAPPVLTTQPPPRAVDQWTSLTHVWVVATGSPPLQYQWMKDAAEIPTAASAAHGIQWVQPSDAGEYTCRVWNAYGEVVSDPGTLTVNPANSPPILLEQPHSRTVNPGANVYFWVDAIGTDPIHYQWKLNDVNIPGGVWRAHGIFGAQPQHEGTYTCRVFNDYGESISDPATLTLQVKK